MDDAERKLNEDAGVSYDSTAPRYYFKGIYLYVKPFASQTVDIRYKKVPVDMSLGPLESTSDDTACALNQQVQDIIVVLATSLALEAAGETVRASIVRNRAETMVKTLNSGFTTFTPVSLEVAAVARGDRF